MKRYGIEYYAKRARQEEARGGPPAMTWTRLLLGWLRFFRRPK